MSVSHELVQKHLDAIEAEMKKVGFWQNEALEAEKYNFKTAFAADTMAFPQWLQFIFIPRVRGILETKGVFPSSSMVGVKAVREFDAYSEADSLTDLLCGFDRLFSERAFR